MRRILQIPIFLCALLALTIAATAAKKPRVPAKLEKQFEAWQKKVLWPKAKALNVSSKIFNAAFKNVGLNLSLPDLVVPGQKAKVPKKQRQAEFGSPEKYFNPKIINGVVCRRPKD